MVFFGQRGRMFETTAVEVTASAVVFTLPDNTFHFAGNRGIIPIKISQSIPSGTTTTLPILFRVNGSTQAVTTVGGSALTAASVTTGLFLFYFDKSANLLQIIGVN